MWKHQRGAKETAEDCHCEGAQNIGAEHSSSLARLMHGMISGFKEKMTHNNNHTHATDLLKQVSFTHNQLTNESLAYYKR